MVKLCWSQREADAPLQAFLARHPPSKTFNPPGGDGWIWVRSNRGGGVEGERANDVEGARKALDGLVERYAEIEGNIKIPKVKSKTSGPSKRMMRESAAKQTENELREMGKRWPCGKWLFYERAAYVDRVYAKLATSLISGPLSKLKHAKCHTIKVATADTLESPSSSGQRREPTALICLFFDNVWDAAHAREVLECVVKEHGEMPNSAKADLYTLAGLDSHHPCKLRSTLYRPSELVNEESLKEWQTAFRARLKRKADDLDKEAGSGPSKQQAGTLTNGNGPRRPEDFWPTATDGDDDLDDEGFEEVNAPAPTTTTRSGQANVKNAKPSAEESDSATEEEDDIIPLRVAAKASSPAPEKAEVAMPQKESTPPEEEAAPLRRTILPVPGTSTAKRDRFGRSDF